MHAVRQLMRLLSHFPSETLLLCQAYEKDLAYGDRDLICISRETDTGQLIPAQD